jgi:hypothetical protein
LGAPYRVGTLMRLGPMRLMVPRENTSLMTRFVFEQIAIQGNPVLSAVGGIQRIRDRLCRPGGVVRLVGLSGVGKTRFVQALFDNRVGDSSLDPTLAFYTDVAGGPEPAPTTLVQNLIASRSRAIIVVDNCPPDIHRRLSDLCRAAESTVSLITVEYDIREDQPEGTEVFELEASSEDLIERLLKQRFTFLSSVDRHTIARFSGGNARIAIALAETVGHEETIAGISNEDLFKRLFEQRHGPSESLLLAAQGLSLVYSFQGEDASRGDEAELFRLGAAVGKSAQEMFHCAAELHRRGLVQRRGIWRAVLPQAISNRLASRCLQDVPLDVIEKHLVNDAPVRLLTSFSRRLGYLDGSPEAQQIVRGWLNVGGFLADVLNLSDVGENIFRNVAPVDPEASLSAIERCVPASLNNESATKCKPYLSLLISLAYDVKLFERSVALLIKIAVALAHGSPEPISQDANEASRALSSLFLIHLSGTHASPQQRELVIRSLLSSKNLAERDLGLRTLAAALEALHFGPVLNFGFGARSRDFGYWPATREEVVEWFRRFLKLGEELVCSNHIEGARVRSVIANKFRGMWTGAAMYDDLEHVGDVISKKVFWVEGWIAVRETAYYDSRALTAEINSKLASLEKLLQPRGIVQQVWAIVLAESASYVGAPLVGNADESVESAWPKLQKLAYDLGRSVAVETDSFAQLLPPLVRAKGDQVWSFGRGIAQGSIEPARTWKKLVDEFKAATWETASWLVLGGFLDGLYQRDRVLAGSLLDEAIEDDNLAKWYPALEAATGTIDAVGLRRLFRSLEFGRVPIHLYRRLGVGGVTRTLAGSNFNKLLLRIAEHPTGVDVAMELLYMRLLCNREASSPDELAEIGSVLFRRLKITGSTDPSIAHRLQVVGKNCLLGDNGAAAVREVCTKLRDAISKYEASTYGHREFLRILFDAQPLAVLQSLCAGNDPGIVKIGVRVLEDSDMLHPPAFDAISGEELFRWCDEVPAIRYPIVATGIVAISHDASGPHWTDGAHRILEKAPDRIQVLRKFIQQFSSQGWDASRVSEVELNLALLDEIPAYSDAELSEFAVKEKARLSEALAAAREVRPSVHMLPDEGFE